MRSASVEILISRLIGIATLPFLLPFLIVIGVAVAIEDGFPVLFFHTRVGRNGKTFRIVKFRSMRQGPPGRQVTSGDDLRITRVGRVLRKYKLDELPQIWNLVRGDMTLVGPRPEAPVFVDASDSIWKTILQAPPGITDLATLVFRNEEEILATSKDPEMFYRQSILPAKLDLNARYLRSRSFWSDTKLIILSAWYSFYPSSFNSERVKKIFCKDAM